MPIAMSVAMPIVTLMMLQTSIEHNTRPEKCDQRNQDQESGASTPSILATAHSEPASIFITAATIFAMWRNPRTGSKVTIHRMITDAAPDPAIGAGEAPIRISGTPQRGLSLPVPVAKLRLAERTKQ
jgi:hypothetical protein